jgi:hypothetical protein
MAADQPRQREHHRRIDRTHIAAAPLASLARPAASSLMLRAAALLDPINSFCLTMTESHIPSPPRQISDDPLSALGTWKFPR